MTLYKNGVQVDTRSFAAIQSGASACRFHVGTRLTECDSTTAVFIDDTRAFLDDVRVYDRALTANEVAALANL